jgi:hypothetical protein
MVLFCREHKGALSISLHVQPRARKTEIVGVHGESLKIKVAAPPVEGAANEELVRFFAAFFGVPQSRVRLKQGAQSRRKVVEIDGASEAELTEILLKQGILSLKLG